MYRLDYYDVSIKRLGERYKVIYVPRIVSVKTRTKDYQNEKSGVKYISSISRARNKVLELGLCNDFSFFVTFTLDKEKFDRYDLQLFRKSFTHYLRNQKRTTGRNVIYLLIPEQHKDGAWHFHGLMGGYQWNDLKEFERGKHPVDLIKKGYRYDENILCKFGFNSFSKIQSKIAVSQYIAKYITKEMALINAMFGAHLYYASQGLKVADVVFRGQSTRILTNIDYQNDFCITAWIDKEEVERIVKQLY